LFGWSSLPLPLLPVNPPCYISSLADARRQQNIYYGTLYAYTPEVLPSAHRGTGNGISIGLNRIMGIVSAGVATGANTATAVPIYICAALYVVMAGVAAGFPFEPMGRRSS
jgi:hypothetical protein